MMDEGPEPHPFPLGPFVSFLLKPERDRTDIMDTPKTMPDPVKLAEAAAEAAIEAEVLRNRVNELGHTREVWAAYDCLATASNALASAAAWLTRHNERTDK